MKRYVLQGIIAGLLSGVLLGFFLKWIQLLTGSGVYTLLLNIDFVPMLPDRLPEWLEFSLHLTVSFVLGFLYRLWLIRWPHPWICGLLIGAASSLLFFPLALMSERVPQVDDLPSYMYWLAGHILYGLVLGLLGDLELRRTSATVTY
ncbi:hypothetical protein [Paenibacillus sp. Z6-24]